jgi:hypothetical protein
MEKLDIRKQYKNLYASSAKQVELVDVPAFNFVSIDGAIEPGVLPGDSRDFQEAMQALYGAAYTLKFMSKLRKEDPIDYAVMASEGLWWVEDGVFDITRADNWKYTLMILHPDHITADMFAEALAQLRRKKPGPGLDRLRFAPFVEGLSIQILHVGPYATEMESIAKMVAFAEQNGYELHGKHHEIYLGNPLRADPSKLKTILRHPVRKKAQ